MRRALLAPGSAFHWRERITAAGTQGRVGVTMGRTYPRGRRDAGETCPGEAASRRISLPSRDHQGVDGAMIGHPQPLGSERLLGFGRTGFLPSQGHQCWLMTGYLGHQAAQRIAPDDV